MAEEQTGHIFTVSELTQAISMLLEARFPAIWVEGEISNLTIARSGHSYFSIKDQDAQLSVVMFKSQLNRNKLELEEGMKVQVFGNIGVYKARGAYQLIATRIKPVGVGELQLAYEKLKKKLYEKGLFASEAKQPIPPFPDRIGIVTSATGAAIRDILHVLDRRFSNLHVIINPVLVQGAQCPAQVVRAIREFNQLNNVDVIIVTRGGGSIEDLWGFNDEQVAYAIFDSKIPVISAVGHEIDWTIADFVADLRVPTPSAAAELVVQRKHDLQQRVTQLKRQLNSSTRQKLDRLRARVERVQTHYMFQQPQNIIRQQRLRIDDYCGRLQTRISHRIELNRNRINALIRHLNLSNPRSVLDRGYSLTISQTDGTIITDAADVVPGMKIQTELKKGSFIATAE